MFKLTFCINCEDVCCNIQKVKLNIPCVIYLLCLLLLLVFSSRLLKSWRLSFSKSNKNVTSQKIAFVDDIVVLPSLPRGTVHVIKMASRSLYPAPMLLFDLSLLLIKQQNRDYHNGRTFNFSPVRKRHSFGED